MVKTGIRVQKEFEIQSVDAEEVDREEDGRGSGSAVKLCEMGVMGVGREA